MEGNVTRVKRLKRDGYGRANFDLLRAQILPALLAALAGRETDVILRAFPELAPAPGPGTRRDPRQETQRSKAEAARQQRKAALQEKYAAIRRDDASGMSERATSASTTSAAAPS